MEKNTVGGRIKYLEQLRVLAIFFVLYCHSGKACLLSYFDTDILPLKIGSIMIASVVQCCICIFFMISGAVLLRKQESVKTILLHRFLPMFLVTVAVVCIQCAHSVIMDKVSFSFRNIAEYIYSGGAITEQWFLYTYLGFLLCLPLLQKLSSVMTSEIAWYLIILMIIIDIAVPMFEAISDFKHIGISVPIFNVVIIMPLFGFFFENRSDNKLYTKKSKFIVAVVLLALIIANTYMNHHSLTHGGKLAYDTLFVGIYALAFFVLFHSEERVSKKSFWGFCGAGVFGVYLFERQFKVIVDAFFSPAKRLLSDYAYGFIEIVLVMAVGIILVNVVKWVVGSLMAMIKGNKPQ